MLPFLNPLCSPFLKVLARSIQVNFFVSKPLVVSDAQASHRGFGINKTESTNVNSQVNAHADDQGVADVVPDLGICHEIRKTENVVHRNNDGTFLQYFYFVPLFTFEWLTDCQQRYSRKTSHGDCYELSDQICVKIHDTHNDQKSPVKEDELVGNVLAVSLLQTFVGESILGLERLLL